MQKIDERPKPKTLNFFSTYLCNSRCVNCGIWRNKEPASPEDEMTSMDIHNLFLDPLARGVHDVGFAGGEPTLTGFMERAVREVPQNLRVTITTNALSPGRLFKVLDEPRLGGWCVQVSMDGLHSTNDVLRGIPGAFSKALNLLNELQIRNIPRLISFTINKLNFNEIAAMAELAEAKGAAFSLRLAQKGGAYRNTDRREQFDLTQEELDTVDKLLLPIIFKELRNPNHNPSRLVFLMNIVAYARGEVRDPACHAMDTGLVLDCYGNVFPNCPQMMNSVGNIKNESLSEIWVGGPANGMRCRIEHCGGCWNDCQIPANIELDYNFLLAHYGNLKKAIAGNIQVKELNWENDSAVLALLGYYDIEGEPGRYFRWTDQRFSFLVPIGVRRIRLTGSPPPDTECANPVELVLSLNGNRVATTSYDKFQEDTQVIEFPGQIDDMSIAEISLNRTYCPRSFGKSNDVRNLGIALKRIDFE